MKKRNIGAIAGILCICIILGVVIWHVVQSQGASVAHNSPKEQADLPVSVIDWNKSLQPVDGFGGSDAFGHAYDYMNMGTTARNKVLDLLFSKQNGIGVSILRLKVGAGKGDTIESEPGKFVWDQPDWDTNKDTFDIVQRWLVKEAEKRGLKTILSTPWSPPAWMKTNGSVDGTAGGKEGSLKKEDYQAYADYLAEYVLGYKKYYGIDINYISVNNEPDWPATYEGCIWTPDQLNVFVRDYLGPTFKAKKVPAKIVMPENMHFSEDYALPALHDPKTIKYIGVVATHAYGGTENGVPPFPVAQKTGKPIWMTEYANGGDGTQTYDDNAMPNALMYGNLIGNMFHTTGLSAYFYWWLAADSQSDGSDLIRLDPLSSTYQVFKRFYAFGNYSRFIDPGYVMIGADPHPVKDVLLTAYKDPKTGHYAIVAVNNSSKAEKITLKLNHFPKGTKAVVPYRTSSTENLKKLDAVSLNRGGQSVTVDLRGESLTTFVPKSAALPALQDMKSLYSKYEAEAADGRSKGIAVKEDPQGDNYLADVKDGDYIKYAKVNFGDGTTNSAKPMKVSIHVRAASIAGGTIEVRLDDPTNGSVVGKMNVPASAQNDAAKWTTVSTMLDTNVKTGAYGIHDLYLVFQGDSGKKLFNVDYITFGDEVAKQTHFSYDFDDNTTQGWKPRAGSSVVQVSQEQSHSGQYSLKTTKRTNTWKGPSLQVTKIVHQGTNYDISAYFRLTKKPAAPVSAMLTMEVDNGKASYKQIVSAKVSGTGWVHLKGKFELKSDASKLVLYVETGKSLAPFYIDDVTIAPSSNS